MKLKQTIASNRGFTLIEIIVSLILVGIMAVVVGMGIVTATKAFIFAKEAAEISQKNQLAMNRLTKSIENWIRLEASPVPNDHSLTLTRNDIISGATVTETYEYIAGNNTLSLTVGGVTTILCERLTGFKLEYVRTDSGGDSFWSPGQSLAELNMVRITMTQAGQSGTNSSTFVSRVVPMNTSMGDIQALSARFSSGSGACFVATAAYGDYDDPAVVLLRQFRDRVLSKSDTGKKFIAWYYLNGPALAGFIAGHSVAGWLARILLAPVVGLVFLMLYFPLGLILIPVMAMLMLRLGYIVITKIPRGHMVTPPPLRGSILIGLIITMVIMAALGAGMVSMFGASNVGNVASMFQPRANYMAESGFANAVKAYLKLDTEANIIANHNRKFTLINGDSFKTFIYPYWFRNPDAIAAGTSTLIVNSVATVNGTDSFPSKFQDTDTGIPTSTRYIRVGTEAKPRYYTSATYNSTNHTVTFGGLSNPDNLDIAANQEIYPAALTLAATISPESSSTSNRYWRVSSSSTALNDFPKNRGVISFAGFTITYDEVVVNPDGMAAGAYFKGLHNIPSATLTPIAASGQSIAAGTMVVLGKHAEIKSKGIAGTEGGSFSAERMLHYDQSLVKIDAWMKTTVTDPTFAGKTDLVGTSNYDATVGALRVDTAQDVMSLATNGTLSGPLSREYVASIAVPSLQGAWESSDYTLSYDMQIKMKFSAGDENITGASTKTPGSYMPGMAFRLTAGAPINKFYGLSVMRGIQGTWTIGGKVYERDGISGYLFEKHNSTNTADAPDNDRIICVRKSFNDFQWTNWTDNSPKDGRPYIILWQREITSEGCNVPTTQKVAWLAYKEACKEERRLLYRYTGLETGFPYAVTKAGWYDGPISGITESNTMWAIRLVDQSNILATTSPDGVTILGAQADGYRWVSVGHADNRVGTVRDPLTGLPVAPQTVTTTAGRTYLTRPVGYIFPGSIGTNPITYETGAQGTGDILHDFLKNNNYRIYPKEWITLMVRLFEIKGDFIDCNGVKDDKVNVIQVHYADPDVRPFGETYGDTKSIIRRAHPKGTIRWPEDGNYLTTTVWNEKVLPTDTSNFSSQVFRTPYPPNCACGGLDPYYNKKIVERTYDATVYPSPYETAKDWPTAITDWYKTPTTSTATLGLEVGLHTMGIDAPNDRAYFADFAMNIYQKLGSGLLPGMRSE